MSVRIKFTFSLFVIVMVALCGGCRKDAPAPAGGTSNLIKMTISNSASGVADTFVYAYDSLGRQIRSQTDTNVITYSYTTGNVIMTHYLAGEQFITDYSLNAAGLAVSDNDGNSYIYNSLGYLTEFIDAGGGSNRDTTFYNIAGSVVDTSVGHQVATGTNNVITTAYTYLPTADSRNYGLSFLGKQNAYLISTASITQVINGTVYNISYSYSYALDYRGRVVLETQSSGTATYTTSYTYY